jgi:hypothetical protein
MSCDTLNTSAIQLNVSVASLPEGFCPNTYQEFANALAERLIISPSTTFNSFIIGSTAPSSNQGPWLKDCTTWFVYDDATASYKPTTKGGFSNMSYVTASGQFTVPDFIYKLKITAFGGGGGGAAFSGVAATAGGGGGACGISIVDVTPGQIIPYTVGTGGTGGPGAGGAPGVDGGNTTILGKTAGGGKGGTSAPDTGGPGGIATGFDINLSGQYGQCDITGTTSTYINGGDAAGWGGKAGVPTFSASAVGRSGTAPGGGGTSGQKGDNTDSGSGADGSILFEW